MASIKPSSRYAAAKSSLEPRSSARSDPSSSAELTPKSHILLRATSRDSSRALVPANPTRSNSSTHGSSFSAMVKKLVEQKSSSAMAKQKQEYKLALPIEDLKKTARKGTGSERELLSMNKEQENQISELKLMLDEKNREVEKLKDLCLKQREDIKSLKNAILFPDVTNLQVQETLENQSSELKQARQLIPSLQRQVTSLTGQLQCLAEDLAEVKAEKYSVRGFNDVSSHCTPEYDQEEATNSLEFSYGDQTTPGSPDDMFLKDLNPCLTPYAKTKSKEFDSFVSRDEQNLHRKNSTIHRNTSYNSFGRKVSKSSDGCHCSKPGSKLARRSDESKLTYGKMKHKL
nr:epidermal growth factor receptor substrate 15 homolog [Ipomoea batatas]